jgi:RNA polymerase sigma-70 factor (ECF subfamily)
MSGNEDEQRRRWFRREILPLEPRLRAYAAQFRRGAEIDDLVQETYARAISYEAWQGVDNPSAFARRILKNIVLDAVRRDKVVAIDTVADLDRFAGADDAPGPEATAIGRDSLRRLQALVAGLPTQQRRVFTLRKIYEMPTSQIAARLGLSVSTVETHLAKALRACSERLARDIEATKDVQSPWQRLLKGDRRW